MSGVAVIARAALAALLALAALTLALPAGALAAGSTTTATTTAHNATATTTARPEPASDSTPVPGGLPSKPADYATGPAAALEATDRDPQIRARKQELGARRDELTAQITAEAVRVWEVGYFLDGDKVNLVVVDATNGEVTESWTGSAVDWPMARGHEGQFGHLLNAPWVWGPLAAVFLLGLVDFRRWRRIVHLDLAVLLSFGISQAFFNAAEIGVAVPLYYPPLLYLLARMLWIGFRGAGRPGGVGEGLRPTMAPWLMAALVVALLGVRIAGNVADSGVIDVGYAGVIGADKITDAEPIYGDDSFPDDNGTGDTYGPANYFAYVPFEQALPWSGAWDDLPAAHAASIFFDLMTVLGLFALGRVITRERVARGGSPRFPATDECTGHQADSTGYPDAGERRAARAGDRLSADSGGLEEWDRGLPREGHDGPLAGGHRELADSERNLADSRWMDRVEAYPDSARRDGSARARTSPTRGGARLRGRRGGVLARFADWKPTTPPNRLSLILAFAWLAYPYSAFALQSNSNDALISALLVWSLVAFAMPLARGALLATAGLAKFAPLALAPLYAAGRTGIRLRTPEARHAVLRPLALFTAAFAAAALLLIAHPAVDPGIAAFYDRTVKSQLDRVSPFSIWGQADLEWLHTAVKLAAIALGVAVAFVPRQRSLPQLAALGAAVIIAVQLTLEHWFYLYIPWFLPMLLAAIAVSAITAETPGAEPGDQRRLSSSAGSEGGTGSSASSLEPSSL